jgi:hypothetical protein
MSDVEVVNLFGETTVEHWHGTVNGYKHYRCRCEPCKIANTDYQRLRRRANQAAITGDEPWHGTRNGYSTHNCRCKLCVGARRKYEKSNREKKQAAIQGDESWHGTLAGYRTHFCRCQLCKLAQRAAIYAINPDRLSKLLSNPRCKVCQITNPARGFVIDHDHKCCPGKRSCGTCVREVICFACNVMIGCAKDDPEILRSGAYYIELHAA